MLFEIAHEEFLTPDRKYTRAWTVRDFWSYDRVSSERFVSCIFLLAPWVLTLVILRLLLIVLVVLYSSLICKNKKGIICNFVRFFVDIIISAFLSPTSCFSILFIFHRDCNLLSSQQLYSETCHSSLKSSISSVDSYLHEFSSLVLLFSRVFALLMMGTKNFQFAG